MANASWFVHIQGETFGPVSIDVIQIMLRQNRLQFSDYVWSDGLTRWTRIGDLHQFVGLMPPYPSVAIPSAAGNVPPPEPVRARAAPASATAPTATSVPLPGSSPVIPPSSGPPGPAAASRPQAESPLKAWIRRYGRVTIEGSVAIDAFGTYPIVDLSEGGVFLKSAAAIPFGTDLRFRLDSPSFPKPLDMTGIVIREGASEDGQAGFAIQFTRVNPAHRRMVHEYVKSRLTTAE